MYETTKQAINKSKDTIMLKLFNGEPPDLIDQTHQQIVQRGTKKIPPRNDHRFRERAEEPMD
jgi:hypothetical protein